MLFRMGLLPAAIPSPSANAVDLGPFTFHVYGLCYAPAVIAAVAITRRRWEAVGGSRELVYDVALWGFPAGIVGGRLYYLATTPGDAFERWWGPFAIWEGGLGIWGGIALGTLVGLWRVKRAGADLARFMDAAAPALLVAQAIGRIGNYFNQELFGRPTDLPWAVEIDPEHRPARFIAESAFHPTFLYELLWNLILAAALVWLGRHRPFAHLACSRSTSPATARSGPSTSSCAWTRRRTSSACAGTCCWRSPARSSAWPGSPQSRPQAGACCPAGYPVMTCGRGFPSRSRAGRQPRQGRASNGTRRRHEHESARHSIVLVLAVTSLAARRCLRWHTAAVTTNRVDRPVRDVQRFRESQRRG